MCLACFWGNEHSSPPDYTIRRKAPRWIRVCQSSSVFGAEARSGLCSVKTHLTQPQNTADVCQTDKKEIDSLEPTKGVDSTRVTAAKEPPRTQTRQREDNGSRCELIWCQSAAAARRGLTAKRKCLIHPRWFGSSRSYFLLDEPYKALPDQRAWIISMETPFFFWFFFSLFFFFFFFFTVTLRCPADVFIQKKIRRAQRRKRREWIPQTSGLRGASGEEVEGQSPGVRKETCSGSFWMLQTM